MLTRWAKTAFLSGLGGVTGGTLTVECPDRTYRFGESGELDATLTVHDERFFLRALTGHDIGLGESFMDGDWTTPELVPLVRLMLRNRLVLEGQSRVTGALRGRRGSFVLLHTGIMTRGTPSLSVIVVPDSATGELVGLSGRMEIRIENGAHAYDFTYELP